MSGMFACRGAQESATATVFIKLPIPFSAISRLFLCFSVAVIGMRKLIVAKLFLDVMC